MTNICAKLQAMLQDEANGILEYNKGVEYEYM